ncbi:lens fiber membrane intrinsic protein-like isoform X2 [Ptychodera flava]|uniref:lens fiber membrane intrinsic protein-like isoform X2 n=1 Tax=Ptychodera flava TaxID=63121 RepID=UPI003969EFE3
MSLVGPIASVVVAAVAVIVYIVSVATNYWVVISTATTKSYYGLWQFCQSVPGLSACTAFPSASLTAYMEATRGLMLTAVIVAVISWILALAGLIGKGTGQSFIKKFTKTFWTINGLIFCATGLLVMIGTTVFAVETNKDYGGRGIDYSFGYSIILGWVSIPLGVIAAALLTYFLRAMCDDE